LPHHAEVVPDRPMLGQLALGNAKPVHLLDGETLARRRDAPQLIALVGAAGRPAYRNHVPVRDDALDVEAGVGERGYEPAQNVLGPAIPR
jgi:hypothetical protein